jgi:hypothetical protein
MVTHNRESTGSTRKKIRASKPTPERADAAADAASLAPVSPALSIEIDLPDLEEAVDVEIVAENLNAVQAIYFAYQLDEMRIVQVVERIVELFREGLLPLGRGDIGEYLLRYYKTATERSTEEERRDVYVGTFGAPGGDASSTANREFDELWLRFVSAVASFARRPAADPLLHNSAQTAASQEEVRKAGRDLGANLSRVGQEVACFAAKELQTTLEFSEIMQHAELRSAFGARDMWQVIDRVNVQYLGGARNMQRHRMQASAGVVIIRWLATNLQRLTGLGGRLNSMGPILELQPHPASVANNPIVNPTNWDLVNACEQWLAATGLQEESEEQYSQPIEAPSASTSPIDLPQVARDLLRGLE